MSVSSTRGKTVEPISASVYLTREYMNNFCLTEQLVNASLPLHECVCFPKRSRSEYTNIQHVLVQQIATICSIRVNPEEINTKGRHKQTGDVGEGW